jgi:hypothetical protein
MSAEIRILDLRLSFIWFGLALELIRDPPPANAPLAFLGPIEQYIKTFEQALDDAGPADLQVPWDQTSPAAHHFWTRYLGGTRVPGPVLGAAAWEKLVPLRGKLPAAAVAAPWVPGPVLTEGFFYPHGFGLVVTAKIRSALSLENAVEKGLEVRRTGRFQVQWEEGGPQEDQSLDNLAHAGLLALRKVALGDAAPAGGVQATRPFTVATVVEGSGVDRDTAPPAEVHRALHALSEWPTAYDWRNPPPAELPDLAESGLKIKAGYPGDVLYARPRGRAVWFPKWFLGTGGKRRTKLSCYHRNVVFLSLQVESLGGLIRATSAQIQAGTGPASGSTHHSVVGQAAKGLTLLYRGDRESTYRSWSGRQQLDQNGFVPPLDVVRDRVLGEGPLIQPP